MPARWLIHPNTGAKVGFEEAPALFERLGILPTLVTNALIAELKGDEGGEFVRPSQLTPKLTCRRQEVLHRHGEYGENPLRLWAMHEGTAIHQYLKTEEVRLPPEGRLEVVGVPMKGTADVSGEDIVDIKSKSPYIAYNYKEKRTYVWEPPDGAEEHKYQLAAYGILREKAGLGRARRGVVWRVWRGVKSEQKGWTKFEFPLLTEEQLEEEIGPWVRDLARWLKQGKEDLEGAITAAAPDGRKFFSERKGYWKCNECELKTRCEREVGWTEF